MTAELRPLLTDRPSVSAGKMAVLGLDGIKARLGSRWDRLSGLVRAFFEAAIKRSMAPGDTCFPVDGLAYVIVYRDLSLAETQAKCAALAQEVCAHLFGEEGLEVGVRSVVGQIDRQLLLKYKNLEAGIEAALEKYGTETIVSLPDSKPSPEASNAKLTLEVGFSQYPRTRLRCSAEQLSFAYRPIWDCTTNVILTYLCQPIPPGSLGRALVGSGGFCTVCSGDDDRVLFDQTILSHCAQYLRELRRSGARLLLALPLHFSTLGRSRAWTQFNNTYLSLEREVLRDIVFVVTELEGVPNIRIVQELPKLAGVRYLFCVIERDGVTAVRGAGGIHALGCELPKKPPNEMEMLGQVKSLVFDARQNGYESFALGVTSTSRALNAMAAGVRYLEGPAIHAMVSDPRHAFVHELEDLYRKRP
jgi:hypothetical protein